MLLARGRLKHQYPHSWRSKKPVIFRNTPQWFIAMDKHDRGRWQAKPGDTLRARALHAISVTQWVPPSGQNRINGMIDSTARLGDLAPARLGRADRGVRAREGRRLRRNPAGRGRQPAHRRSLREGRRRRLVHGRRARALPRVDAPPRAGRRSTTSSTSGSIPARRTPSCWKTASTFPSLGDIVRKIDGGDDTVMYLEGCDQHRGWFQSSLLESCGTRGRAPYRRGADPRLHAGRERPQDVEVARQHRRAAKGDQGFRRRYPAAVGLRHRLCRRPAHRPGDPEEHHRDLPQAAQLDPLDARHAASFQVRRRGRAMPTCPSSNG